MPTPIPSEPSNPEPWSPIGANTAEEQAALLAAPADDEPAEEPKAKAKPAKKAPAKKKSAK